MKKIFFAGLSTGLFMFAVVGTGQATSIIMEGDYVRTAVSDNGTIGYGGSTTPGIIHDATGTGDFSSGYDYLTPGSPWEVFSVSSTQTGLLTNNNTSPTTGDISSISLLDLSTTSVYDSYLRWEGSSSGLFGITTDYFFNEGDERISLRTTITATVDLSEVYFLRAIDPDQDSYASPGTPSTTNGRGGDANNDGDFTDPGDLAPEDWVYSEGTITGWALGLYSDSEIEHNTGVTSWSDNPQSYNGTVSSAYGDQTIGISFSVGSLGAGDSVVLDYAYVMGDSLETVDIPSDPVPEPATMLLFGTGLAGLIGSRIRKKKK